MSKPSTDLTQMKTYHVAMHQKLSDGDIYSGATMTDKPTFGLNPQINMANFIEAAWLSGSPYSSAYAYDPEPALEELEAAIDALSDGTADLNAITEWEAAVDAAVTKADTAFGDSTGRITARAAVFDSEYEATYNAQANRVTAATRDQLRGTNPSTLIALSILEHARSSASADYRARLEEINEQGRSMLINSAPSSMTQHEGTLLEYKRNLLSFRDALARLRIVANKEFYAEELDIAYRDLTWDMNLILQYGLPTLGVLGAPISEKGPSKASTAVSTGLTFASTAIQMGAPPAAAAAIGGIGLLAGLVL